MKATSNTGYLRKKRTSIIRLGISVCYDIVKAHGGELKVETKEGEGSEFVILLPI